MNAVEVKNLKKTFGPIVALGGVDMEVKEGEIYGFLGPNGAGKTTTLRVIMGLLEGDEGEVKVFGEDLTRSSRSKIGYLPEKVSLYGRMTVEENIRFFCRIKGLAEKECIRVITEFKLERFKGQLVKNLSRGQLQRLGLAQASIGKPRLLVLDEPTSGLDPNVRKWVKEKIKDLKKKGVTILLSSHVLEEAQEVCDRVGIISDGGMLVEDKVDSLVNDLELEDRLILDAYPKKKALELLKETEEARRSRILHGKLITYGKGSDKIGIIKMLIDEGIDVRDLNVHEPDLEEVFVKLTEGAR